MDSTRRRSAAEIRIAASELALESEIIRAHIRRMQARLQTVQAALQRELYALELRLAADEPMALPAVPEFPLGMLGSDVVVDEADGGDSDDGRLVAPIVRCGHPLRGNPANPCARSRGHAGKHRSHEAQARRARHKRDVRARGKAPQE